MAKASARKKITEVSTDLLSTAFAPVSTLEGCGEKTAELIRNVAGPSVVDLWWTLPTNIVDRRYSPKISEALPDRVATMAVQVIGHEPPKNNRHPYKVLVGDETGEMHLVFFNGRAEFLQKTLPLGGMFAVSGNLSQFNGMLQMTQPDRIAPVEELADLMRVEPIYPLTEGLSSKVMTKIAGAAVTRTPPLMDWLSDEQRKEKGWPSWQESILQAHRPAERADLDPASPARERLAYDELLAEQLSFQLIKRGLTRQAGRGVVGDGSLRERLLQHLPWPLTGDQAKAISEIENDMASDRRMLRLLQGDVGSGKTMVALNAMLIAVEAGAQAALMAPTEILARQHYLGLKEYCKYLDVRVALLTGRDNGKARAELLMELAAGEIDILIGTHAIYQDDVVYNNLALAVIDEQHRFGVDQRLALTSKGRDVDVLMMTATPIPRTQAFTVFGEMEFSVLREKPPGRKPVDTRVLPQERVVEVAEALARRVNAGHQAYWVCPLVDEGEKNDLIAASVRAETLAGYVDRDKITLIHGKMTGAEKEAAMADFAAGRTRVLVATSIIEVGVDVPEATLMVIEQAERFGLSQLHQLRGRVGRGDKEGVCLLIYGDGLSEAGRTRLKVIRDTEDGFAIAEADLRLRGFGDMVGSKQSGIAKYRIADLDYHGHLLLEANEVARKILNEDPALTSEEGDRLRMLLRLQGKNDALGFCHVAGPAFLLGEKATSFRPGV